MRPAPKGNAQPRQGEMENEMNKASRKTAAQQKETATQTKLNVTISAPNFATLQTTLIGIAPYCQARFGAKAMQAMRDKMTGGSQANKGKKREPRDFGRDYEEAKHVSRDGWIGIPAPCFRNAMISACRIIGFKMTLAKLALFVEADGFDKIDGTPLVKISGDPRAHEMVVRNATGVADIRVRPIWDEWQCDLRIRYDSDMFSPSDIINLLARVGMQVGIGEGRPDSKSSAGLGWGMFRIKEDDQK